MADPYADIPELSAEASALARRRKIAEAMMARGQAPLESPGTAGGAPVPVHWTQGLAQLANAYLGGRQGRELDAAERGLAERRTGMESEAINKVRQAMLGTPEQQAPYQADRMPGEAPIPGLTTVTPAQPATPEQKRAAIEEAMLSPFSRVQNFGALQFAEQGRQETRAAGIEAQRTAREDAAELKRWTVEENHKNRVAELAAAGASKAQIAEENRKHDERMLRLTASLRQPPQPAAPTVVTNSAGDVTLLDRVGNVIKTLPGGGKPSATFEKTAAAKTKLSGDLNLAISELEKATKEGGLIDQSTGSGAGALVDTAAGFFGKSTPGAIAAGQMKPIYDLALKMVPRFEGPQSDKDTKSYAEAAGQLANPAVPNAIKKTAGREILRLMKARKGQFVDASVAGTEADTGRTAPVTAPGVDALLEKYK